MCADNGEKLKGEIRKHKEINELGENEVSQETLKDITNFNCTEALYTFHCSPGTSTILFYYVFYMYVCMYVGL